MRLARKFTLVAVTLAACAYASWTIWERRWYEGQLPADLPTESVVSISVESGWREGCGAAVFRLTPQATEKVRRQGLIALADARQARADPKPYFAYEAWLATPYLETGDGLTLRDRWLNGLACASLAPELRQRIDSALHSTGSFYTRSAEGGLIIIPSEGLVVLSFEG